ncbi:hypothetical protein D6D17_08226 [Aureobasidium pullulans]|nr:hypothetical protein D6D17_08226 [Aureobasidium pullulans]
MVLGKRKHGPGAKAAMRGLKNHEDPVEIIQLRREGQNKPIWKSEIKFSEEIAASFT